MPFHTACFARLMPLAVSAFALLAPAFPATAQDAAQQAEAPQAGEQAGEQAEQAAAPQIELPYILPSDVERELEYIRKYPSRARRDYMDLAFNIASDGVVTKDGLLGYLAGQQADERARGAVGILCYDLNADGLVQISELKESYGRLTSVRRKTALSDVAARGDADGDGALSLAEIYAYVDANERRRGSRSSRRLAVIMMMDVDMDGAIPTEDIATFVDTVQGMAEEDLRGMLAALLRPEGAD